MAIFSQYGSGQRVGFALVSVGFCLCFIGSIAPHWITANYGTNLAKMYAGVWWFCVSLLSNEQCYNLYSPDSDSEGGSYVDEQFAWINVVRVGVVFNGLLGFICMIAACCRCMCCSGGRTICHGITAFLAAACGFGAIGTFSSNTENLVSMPLADVSYGWAYIMFICGTIMMGISSLLLCCSPPLEHHTGMVMMGPPGGVSVNVSQSTSNQYNAPVPMYQPMPYAVPMGGVAPPPNPAYNNQYPPGATQQPPAYGYDQAVGPVYGYDQAAGPDPFAKK